jgi:hypothetical protein
MPRMNLTPSNPKPTTAELLAAYADLSTTLGRTGRELLEEHLELEAAGASPDPAPAIPDDAPEQRARELVNGFAPPERAKGAAGRLHQVISERRAIVLALDMLASAERQTRTVALAEWLRDGGEDRWIESRRRLADALMAVRGAVEECRAIRSEATSVAGGQQVCLPSDRGDRPMLTEAAQVTLEAIAAEKIISGQGIHQ